MIAITIQRQLTISRLPSRIVFGIAHFSTNRQLLAVGRAPKVRKLEHERIREAQRKVPSRYLPSQETLETTTIVELPKSLIVEAQVAGKLSVGWSEAQKILDEFDGTRLKSGSAKDLCLKHNIEPFVLTQLAKILLLTQVQANFDTITGLFLAATELEDPAAALLLVRSHVNRERDSPRISFFKKAYEILERLVRAENRVALFLQGRIYERQGNNKRALEMYIKSTEISTDTYADVEVNIKLGDAWMAISRLRMQGNDLAGAEEAIKKAAFDCDDSAAYLYLATKMTDPSSDEYEEYLLQAAVSAETGAAGELGAHYFKKLQKSGAFVGKSAPPFYMDSSKPLTMRVRRGQIKDHDEWELWSQAFEWLSFASESKVASSQIYYAIMCRALQKPNVGLKWLDEASQTPELAMTIAWLKEMWFSEKLDLSDFDLGKILQNRND